MYVLAVHPLTLNSSLHYSPIALICLSVAAEHTSGKIHSQLSSETETHPESHCNLRLQPFPLKPFPRALNEGIRWSSFSSRVYCCPSWENVVRVEVARE